MRCRAVTCFPIMLLLCMCDRGAALQITHHPSRKSLSRRAVPPQCAASAVSLLSGMVSGAVGVGAAYPLDTIKTKMQVYGGNLGPIGTARAVWQNEGIRGFYSGASSTMAGQAMIKGVLFFTYDAVTSLLANGAPTTWDLAIAAAVAGAVGSLVVTPVERIKVVMQALFMALAGTEEFSSPVDCVVKLVRSDGLGGFLTRGLGATLVREIPSCILYFLAYEISSVALLSLNILPADIVPLFGGAAAGVGAWVPVYPIDVVKTNLQASVDKGRGESFFGCARRLYATGGVGIFWDGLAPKLVRAVVNHGVTFYVFNLLTTAFAGAPIPSS